MPPQPIIAIVGISDSNRLASTVPRAIEAAATISSYTPTFCAARRLFRSGLAIIPTPTILGTTPAASSRLSRSLFTSTHAKPVAKTGLRAKITAATALVVNYCPAKRNAFEPPIVNTPADRTPSRSPRVCGHQLSYQRIISGTTTAAATYIRAAANRSGGRYSRPIEIATNEPPHVSATMANNPIAMRRFCLMGSHPTIHPGTT